MWPDTCMLSTVIFLASPKLQMTLTLSESVEAGSKPSWHISAVHSGAVCSQLFQNFFRSSPTKPRFIGADWSKGKKHMLTKLNKGRDSDVIVNGSIYSCKKSWNRCITCQILRWHETYPTHMPGPGSLLAIAYTGWDSLAPTNAHACLSMLCWHMHAGYFD